MRIVEFIISNGYGGAETVVHELSRYLIQKNLDVKIFLNQEIKEYFSDFDEAQIKNLGSFYTKEKNKKRYQNYLNSYLNPFRDYFFLNRKNRKNLNFLRMLKKNLSDYNPDIIHIHLFETLKTFQSIRFCLKRCPVIFTMHGDLGLNKIYLDVRKIINKKFIKKSIKNVDYLTFVSKYLSNIVEKRRINFSKANKEVIPNGIDLNSVSRIKKSKCNNDFFKMVFVGGGRVNKGGILLIKSLPIIKKQIPNFKLYILGKLEADNKIRKYVLKKNINHYVSFVGIQRYPEYYKYIKSADIGIIPSISEGFGISILDFMACGKPIIATNIGGIPELISDYENGLLVKPKPKSIAKGILTLSNNPELRNKMINKNLLKCKRYSWDAITNQYILFFSKIIN